MDKLNYMLFSLVVCCMASCTPASRQETVRAEGQPEFKTIIRLWHKHHEDSLTNAQLMEAFKQYPKACDEVWFELGRDAESLRKLNKAAEDMRKLGIRVSLQDISIGHPSGKTIEGPDADIPFRKIVGPDGRKCQTQYCPRGAAFLSDISHYYAQSAATCLPESVWIDDDLRTSLHDPAEDICYCDSCLYLFNQQHSTTYTREALVSAMNRNADNGELRYEWRKFSSEGIAEVARAISRAVHEVSPNTQMAFQAVNLTDQTLEAYDYMEVLNAMKEETGIAAGFRPGCYFYNDYEPREMFAKAFEIARRINRISPDIIDIAPEIEGYQHRATGKSPHCLPVETMLYLAMGATQMSYAIICGAHEPMQWYADNYFRELDKYHDYMRDYADYNFGCKLAGVDPYISPNYLQNCNTPNWKRIRNASTAHKHCTLGIPFSPESPNSCVLMMNAATIDGVSPAEADELLHTRNMVFDTRAWQRFLELFDESPKLTAADAPEGLQDVTCHLTENGKRIAVVTTFGNTSGSWDLDNAQRLNLINVFDWASGGKLPVIEEGSPQLAVFPRADKEGKLRSVLLLNCTISDQHDIKLRLRVDCADGVRPTLVYKQNEKKDIRLKADYNGHEATVTIPSLERWDTGWIAVEY